MINKLIFFGYPIFRQTHSRAIVWRLLFGGTLHSDRPNQRPKLHQIHRDMILIFSDRVRHARIFQDQLPILESMSHFSQFHPNKWCDLGISRISPALDSACSKLQRCVLYTNHKINKHWMTLDMSRSQLFWSLCTHRDLDHFGWIATYNLVPAIYRNMVCSTCHWIIPCLMVNNSASNASICFISR